MKHILLLLITITLTSCGLFFEEPDFHKKETNNTEQNNRNTTNTTNSRGDSSNTNERGNSQNQNASSENEKNDSLNTDTIINHYHEEPYVEYNSGPSLTFNLYLYSQEKVNETIYIETNKNGGTVYFNIYANYLNLSIYGFSIYDKNQFYEFSDVYPYCGYNSFILTEVRDYAPYKLIIKENNSGRYREAHGYWAVNDGCAFYREFHVVIKQSYN